MNNPQRAHMRAMLDRLFKLRDEREMWAKQAPELAHLTEREIRLQTANIRLAIACNSDLYRLAADALAE